MAERPQHRVVELTRSYRERQAHLCNEPEYQETAREFKSKSNLSPISYRKRQKESEGGSAGDKQKVDQELCPSRKEESRDVDMAGEKAIKELTTAERFSQMVPITMTQPLPQKPSLLAMTEPPPVQPIVQIYETGPSSLELAINDWLKDLIRKKPVSPPSSQPLLKLFEFAQVVKT